MKELIMKLKEANRMDALDSVDAFKEAAREFGISEEEVERLLEDIGDFPLDDDEIEGIVGGITTPLATTNRNNMFYSN